MTGLILQTILVIGIVILIATVIWYLSRFNNLIVDTRIMIAQGIYLGVEFEQLSELAVSVWRLNGAMTAVHENVDDSNSKKLRNAIDRIGNYLNLHDIEIVDYSGRNYNEGLNIEVLNYEVDAAVIQPMIAETKYPEIRHKGIVRKKSQVIVFVPKPTDDMRKSRASNLDDQGEGANE